MAGNGRILLVEDEPGIARLVKLCLIGSGLDIRWSPELDAAVHDAIEAPPALILVDVADSVQLTEAFASLRATCSAPVMVLTTDDGDTTRRKAEELGVVEVVSEPFEPEDLRRRIEAFLDGEAAKAVIVCEDVELDVLRRKAANHGHLVQLGVVEWRLLETLAAHHGQVASEDELLTEVWGPDYGGEAQYLSVYIEHLRRKIGDWQHRIIEEMGEGYCLAEQTSSATGAYASERSFVCA